MWFVDCSCMQLMQNKEPQKPLEHISKYGKSQTFLGACPLTLSHNLLCQFGARQKVRQMEIFYRAMPAYLPDQVKDPGPLKQ